MCKDKIEKRQSELQKEAETLVNERSAHGKRINEINVRLEQIKGAFTELENQKADEPPVEEDKKTKAKK